ncbi:MAG: biotin--[acetyl-CoA-carboxylase] ligase [Bacteroidales bacterium]|nr:biotin--[acetyl-CoA-carboxylase] ligase [Bacteroidales bacterium]
MPEIIHIDKTNSTNTYLRDLINSDNIVEEGTVVWADFQTAGRGQRGNSWESEDKENILFSIVLCPDTIDASEQFIISQLVSLGIVEYLNSLCKGFCIKWPNDIYYQDKKIAGMLIENDMSGRTISSSIIGIGLNVNQSVFVSNAPNPISLYNILNRKFEREKILTNILNTILKYYSEALNGNFINIRKKYMDNLFRKEGFHKYMADNIVFEAKVEEIKPMGFLCLKTTDGEMREFAFKEVEYILK